jgi:hypothetical protein
MLAVAAIGPYENILAMQGYDSSAGGTGFGTNFLSLAATTKGFRSSAQCRAVHRSCCGKLPRFT